MLNKTLRKYEQIAKTSNMQILKISFRGKKLKIHQSHRTSITPIENSLLKIVTAAPIEKKNRNRKNKYEPVAEEIVAVETVGD